MTELMPGWHGHHLTAGRDVVWLTPPHVLDALGRFDLDPCAAPEPRPWTTANIHYAPPDDGLSLPWFGRVWCNPPYGAQAWRWLERLADHGTGTALVPARTDVNGFHQTIFERAAGILFLRGRLTFLRADGSIPPGNSGAPSCLIAYGKRDAELLTACRLPGAYIQMKETR